MIVTATLALVILVFQSSESKIEHLSWKDNSILVGYVGIQQTFDRIYHCLQLCALSKSCKSINFYARDKICHINNKRADGSTTYLTTLTGFVYLDADKIPKVCTFLCAFRLSVICGDHFI